MKKLYLIEITETERKNIWYSNKIGNQYEAELFIKSYDEHNRKGIIVFEVNPGQFVHLLDCKIISERTVETYKK